MIDKYRPYIIGFLLLIIAIGLYLIYQEPEVGEKVENSYKVVIDISGGVRKPGVYTLTKKNRVIDAINKAGGLTKKADLNKISSDINQASYLEDEQKIQIPLKQSKIKSSVAGSQTEDSSSYKTSQADGAIDINTASASQLEGLPGIGPVYASRIVELRSKLGRFSSINQLLEVSGIGDRTLEKITPYVGL